MIEDLVRQINRLQLQVDNLIKPEVGLWVTWTPTITQSVAVTKTVNFARYIVSNKAITVLCRMTCTSAGTAGNIIVVSGLSVTAANSPATVGSCIITNGATIRAGIVSWVTGTGFTFYSDNQTNAIGITPNFGLANNDVIDFCAKFELS